MKKDLTSMSDEGLIALKRQASKALLSAEWGSFGTYAETERVALAVRDELARREAAETEGGSHD
jgi:hypothetical protein